MYESDDEQAKREFYYPFMKATKTTMKLTILCEVIRKVYMLFKKAI